MMDGAGAIPYFYVAAIVVIFFAAILFYNFFIRIALSRYVSRLNRDPATGIIRGAEPIHLQSSSGRAVLLLHGFIGSPKDFGRLPALLHQRGFTVSAPLLPGHGTDPRDFSKTTAEELEEFTLRELRKIREKHADVTVIGFSMGGSLGILASLREKVDRLVLVAPYLQIAHQWYYIFPSEFYHRIFLPLIPYVYKPAAFKRVRKKESSKDIIDYAYVSLKGADAAIRLGRKAMDLAPSLINPILILHSTLDHAVDYKASKKLGMALSSQTHCKFVSLSQSDHLILRDHDAELAENEILRFLVPIQSN